MPRNPGGLSLRNVYLGLVLLRLVFAIFGTGYIHPDEYFQNGEASAGTNRVSELLSTILEQFWQQDMSSDSTLGRLGSGILSSHVVQ